MLRNELFLVGNLVILNGCEIINILPFWFSSLTSTLVSDGSGLSSSSDLWDSAGEHVAISRDRVLRSQGVKVSSKPSLIGLFLGGNLSVSSAKRISMKQEDKISITISQLDSNVRHCHLICP